MSVQTDLEKLRKAKADYRALIKAIGTDSIKELCEQLFTASGHVISAVKWSQYTPYFNDGDACEFGVNEAAVSSAVQQFLDEDSEDEEAGWKHAYEFGHYDPAGLLETPRRYDKIMTPEEKICSEALNAFNGDLQEFEEVLLECFGDHVEVTYTDGAFTVEDYDHD